MTKSVRMSVSVASRKGISALTREAASYRVVLTSFGRAVAVVDSAERIDEDLRKIREAARLVVESMAENAKGRSTRLDLEEVCNRLGISVADVHARAQQLQDARVTQAHNELNRNNTQRYLDPPVIGAE